jgi:hypothetical protein
MHPPAPLTCRRVEPQRSHFLIHDSRVLIASAQELIHQARRSMARQRYRKLVCAWGQRTMRWECSEQAARGPISHSICLACFADVFRELAPVHPTPPLSHDGAPGARGAPRGAHTPMTTALCP